MKTYLMLCFLLIASTAWAEEAEDNKTVLPVSEFGGEETLGTGFVTDFVESLTAKSREETQEKKEYGYNISKYATAPVFGAYIIGAYKYSSQDGKHDGDGFNARLIRAYVDGSILTDFKYRLQVELNGSPHIKDFYLEWAKYKEFSVKIGQFKRAFTFENPLNPWDVGVGDYSQAVKKLAGMGDKCGEPSTGGRDQGLQVQGDLFPVGKDKHRLIHYQLAVYNGNGINQADNNSRKDVIGTLQVQPVKGLFLGFFGWTGDWQSGGITVKRDRYAISGMYEKDNWSARAEYVHSTGHSVTDYNTETHTWSGTGKADAFYALVGVPVLNWLKIYLKYDQYREEATVGSRHAIYAFCPNFRLHKNLNLQLEYNFNNDRTSADRHYSELWLETYVRF